MKWPEPIERLLAEPGTDRIVAFDADGTLWRGDVGEELLRHLAHRDELPGWHGRTHAYAEYERRVAIDPPDAYAFAVAVMAGWSDEELGERCRVFFAERFKGRIFPFTRPLLSALGAAGYRPWVVSASPRWAVEAGAAALGVPAAQVIAVDAVLDGQARLTSQVVQPLPAGEGKVAQLRARRLAPVLALGNGELDLPMLAAARAAVVVAPFDEPGNGLVQAARERGWPVLRA